MISSLVYDTDMWIEGLDYIDYVLLMLGLIVIASVVALILEKRKSKDE